jgi:menaquinone-9 beta-reductase
VPIDRVGLHVRRWSTSFALRQSALSLTRRELDAALWQRARQIGIEAIDRTRVQRIECSNGGRFHVATAERSYVAKSVVNATGRWSELRSDLKHRTNFIGIKAHCETGRAVDPVCDLYFFRGGYVGIQPISRTLVNVSAVVDASQFRDIESVFVAAGLSEVASDWQPLFPSITCPLVKHETPEPLRDGVLQCGDAAAFLDPFAGDGMSLALHSGVLAGECIASSESYASRYQAFSRTFRTASFLRKFVFAPHWLQSTGLQMMRIPWIAQLAIANTRASR